MTTLTELTGGAPEAMLDAARTALGNAIHSGFLVMLGAGLLAFARAVFLPRITFGHDDATKR